MIFKLKNNMSPADFRYVLVKRFFFQNMKEKIWHHLNILKSGPESTKIEAVCQLDSLNICHCGF